MLKMSDNFLLMTAKTSREQESLWLPLTWHLMDTAEVIKILLNEWLPTAVCDEMGMNRTECRKIACFLGLAHDLGKATPVFQKNILERRPEQKAALESAGYAMPISLDDKKIKHAHAGAVLLRNAGCSESIAEIIGAHHGRPESWDECEESEEELLVYTKQYGQRGSVWSELQDELIGWLCEKAEYSCLQDVPEVSERAQMLFSGLLIMADWIASNALYFPLLSVDDLVPDYDRQRALTAMEQLALPEPLYMTDYWSYASLFQERFGFTENPVQRQVQELAGTLDLPGMIILEAPMGEGKTEAALAAAEIFINRFQLGGLAFFLPSQATSNAMFERILGWLKNQPDAERISVQLSHANANLNENFAQLARGNVELAEDADEQLVAHSFFRGRKTQLLSDVVVGTVDQLLMAALKQKHVMLRHLGIAGKVVVIDECHAYDAYMNVYLDRILQWLGRYGVPVILLSATLPGARREALLKAYIGKKKWSNPDIRASHDYPLLSWTEKEAAQMKAVDEKKRSHEVAIHFMKDEQIPEAVKKVMGAGGCIGMIFNTVARVQQAAEIIAEQFPDADILVDHARFLLPDRLEQEAEIIRRVGKNSAPEMRKKVIVIGSQVLEQSLDLDFDLLITDLCPMDLLMQRIGRLHRHSRLRPDSLKRAECVVLQAGESEAEKGAQAVYGEYLLRQTASLLPEKLSMPEDISRLVQETYDEDEGSNRFPDLYQNYTLAKKKAEQKARTFCLFEPGRRDSTIAGLLDDTIGFSEPQARAAVRDGESSLEVIVLKCIENQKAEIIAGEQKGMQIRMDCLPSWEEARELASQRLRLPSRFSRQWNLEKNIQSLETKARQYLSEWLTHPMLEGELFLLMDEENNTVLDHMQLHYDQKMGLVCQEECNEREGI